MVWKTKQLVPERKSDADFIESYPSYILELEDMWNDFRREKFKNQEPIFGYTTEALDGELPEVFTDDFLEVRMTNEEQWQAACVRSLQNKTEFLHPAENIPEYDDISDWPYESSLHDDMFFQISKYRFKIETSKGEMRRFKFVEPITNMDNLVRDMAPPVLNFEDTDNPTLEIYIEEETSPTKDVELSQSVLEDTPAMAEKNSFFESVFPSINLLGVYTGVFQVGVFEVKRGNSEDAENVFELFGMYSVEVPVDRYTNSVYLITYSRDKFEAAQELAKNPNNTSMEELYSLFEYPTLGAKQVTELREEAIDYLHILPGLEFAVYGVQNEYIDSELASYWPYVYYRPPFSIEGVKEALEKAEELYTTLRENKNMFSEIEGDSVSPLVEEFLHTSEQNIGWPELLSTIYIHRL